MFLIKQNFVLNNKYDQLLSFFTSKLLFNSDLFITFQVILKMFFFSSILLSIYKGFNTSTNWQEYTIFHEMT